MFRRIEDFTRVWEHETDSTGRVLAALTDAALAQPVAPGGRTLGRIAWHLALTLPEMMGHAGLPVTGPAEDAPMPGAAGIATAYAAAARALGAEVAARWTDAMLEDTVPMYGQTWARGTVLFVLVQHQAHHRGQLTVLMRQAGLRVPGVSGPSAEEWAGMGLPPQA